MTIYELIVLVLTLYAFLGGLCTLGAMLSRASWRLAAFCFFCWPVIAWHGLKLLIARTR